MTGLPLFDLADGLRRKQDGIRSVEEHQETFVRIARAAAIRIAMERGEVTSDDVRDWCAARGLRAPHSRCWGAVFGANRSGKWVYVTSRPSRIPENHGHRNGVYRFVPNPEAM